MAHAKMRIENTKNLLFINWFERQLSQLHSLLCAKAMRISMMNIFCFTLKWIFGVGTFYPIWIFSMLENTNVWFYFYMMMCRCVGSNIFLQCFTDRHKEHNISTKYMRPRKAKTLPYTFICWNIFRCRFNASDTTIAVKMPCKQYAKNVFTPNTRP